MALRSEHAPHDFPGDGLPPVRSDRPPRPRFDVQNGGARSVSSDVECGNDDFHPARTPTPPSAGADRLVRARVRAARRRGGNLHSEGIISKGKLIDTIVPCTATSASDLKIAIILPFPKGERPSGTNKSHWLAFLEPRGFPCNEWAFETATKLRQKRQTYPDRFAACSASLLGLGARALVVLIAQESRRLWMSRIDRSICKNHMSLPFRHRSKYR